MSVKASSAKDVVLARVREALQLPAPPPHLKSHDLQEAAGISNARPAGAVGTFKPLSIAPLDVARPWLPEGGQTPEERMHILCDNLKRLKAEFHRACHLQAAAELIFSIARQRDWQRVAYHRHELVDPVASALHCATVCIGEPASFDKRALEQCDAGITACESLVAQTGSILVSSATCGGRSLSILPPVHIVIAHMDQIVATLEDALHDAKFRHAGRMPSMLSFITGPSRTGDIERILVLGAHGPKELIVVLVGESP